MLKKLLFKATDKTGNNISDHIEARSTEEALSILEYKGYSNIVFLNDTVTAISDPDGLHELSANPEFEIKNLKSPGFKTFIIEVFRQNRWIILLGVGISLVFWWANNLTFTIVGGLIALSMPLLSIWSYRVVSRYDQFLEAYSYGNAEKVYRLANSLRAHMTAPEMQFDLDIRCATMRAKYGELERALSDIKKWKSDHAVGANGIYESRVSQIYLAAGDKKEFLSLMREAKEKNTDNSQTIQLDLALAEALYGDIAKAEALLSKIKVAELIEMGAAYIYWLEGLIASTKNDINLAEQKLILATNQLFEYAKHPAAWTAIAACLVDFSLVANSAQNKAFAKEAMLKFWKIIQIHADPQKVGKIKALYNVTK